MMREEGGTILKDLIMQRKLGSFFFLLLFSAKGKLLFFIKLKNIFRSIKICEDAMVCLSEGKELLAYFRKKNAKYS